MAIITKEKNGVKYIYEAKYENIEGKKRNYKWTLLGKLDENGNLIASKKFRNKKIEDFPAEIQKVITTKTKIRIVEKKDFSPIRQGTLTNKFNKLTPRLNNFTLNRITGIATYEREKFKINLTNFNKVAGFKTSTHKLFTLLIESFTINGAKSEEIRLPLKLFMEKRGLKDEKTARAQIKADLETLSNTKITFTQHLKGGKSRDYFDLGIIQNSKGIVNGVIIVYLETALFNLLKNYNIMPVHDLVYRLSDKYNPNSYYFLMKILEHKNMNYDKSNADIISVETLLNASPELPTHKELFKTTKNYQHIIEPFERDMDALNEALTWEYCHTNGMPLTDDELENFDYEIFSKLLIKIHWRNYPERENKTKKLPAKKKETKIF